MSRGPASPGQRSDKVDPGNKTHQQDLSPKSYMVTGSNIDNFDVLIIMKFVQVYISWLIVSA